MLLRGLPMEREEPRDESLSTASRPAPPARDSRHVRDMWPEAGANDARAVCVARGDAEQARDERLVRVVLVAFEEEARVREQRAEHAAHLGGASRQTLRLAAPREENIREGVPRW